MELGLISPCLLNQTRLDKTIILRLWSTWSTLELAVELCCEEEEPVRQF